MGTKLLFQVIKAKMNMNTTKLVGKNKMLALSRCCPQLCSSAGGMFAASRSRSNQFRSNVLFPHKQIRCNALYSGFHWDSAFVREIPNPASKTWDIRRSAACWLKLINAGRLSDYSGIIICALWIFWEKLGGKNVHLCEAYKVAQKHPLDAWTRRWLSAD